jgi:hypothetical protein
MKTMKLKSLDQVDLKKIFPVLNVDLYKIIEGRNIEIHWYLNRCLVSWKQ